VILAPRRCSLAVAVAAAAAACTPNQPTGPRVKYDGPVATALATLAGNCRSIGIAADQPLERASDFTCTSDTAEVVIHLDKSRTLRSVQIKLLAASTDDARAKLDEALRPALDDHHRENALSHLDEPVPGGLSPIPQLSLEGFLYQVASEPAGDQRRYIFKVRID